MKYCPKCGKAGVEGVKFCPKCGESLTSLDLEEKQEYVHQPEVQPKGGKMRIAAGIMLIILGLLSWQVPSQIVTTIAWERATSIEDFVRISSEMDMPMLLAALLLIILIVGAGICALRKKVYSWALSGAVCLILAGITLGVFWPHFRDPVSGRLAGLLMGTLYALPGILAVIFLQKRKDDFLGLPPSEHKLAGE